MEKRPRLEIHLHNNYITCYHRAYKPYNIDYYLGFSALSASELIHKTKSNKTYNALITQFKILVVS